VLSIKYIKGRPGSERPSKVLLPGPGFRKEQAKCRARECKSHRPASLGSGLGSLMAADSRTYRDAIQPPPENAKTQGSRILRLLIDACGAWVPLPEIMACAAQYNTRIFELRRSGYHIENRTETIDGQRHSWFRLVVDSPASRPAPSKPEPANPVAFQDRPRVTGLPLWDVNR
jgi:hypothetical protein